jgi:hypothetical protein
MGSISETSSGSKLRAMMDPRASGSGWWRSEVVNTQLPTDGRKLSCSSVRAFLDLKRLTPGWTDITGELLVN